MVSSIGYGVLGSTEDQLFKVPVNSQIKTSLLSFVNISSAQVLLTVYKTVLGTDYAISPYQMALPPGYMAQEDGEITLSNNDSISAVCSIAGAVQYVINGEIITNGTSRKAN